MSAIQDMLEMDSIVQVSLCFIMLPYVITVVFVVLELDIPFVFQMLFPAKPILSRDVLVSLKGVTRPCERDVFRELKLYALSFKSSFSCHFILLTGMFWSSLAIREYKIDF